MKGAVHFVRKSLRRGGVAWYVYAWRGGPQVLRSEGPTRPKLTPELMKRIVAAQENAPRSDDGTLRGLIRQWRSRDPNRASSPEWEALAETTKKTWGSALDRIEEKWGEVPLTLFDDRRMKSKVVAWRDSRANTPRAADIGITVLHALLRFGVLRGTLTLNVAAGIPNLYRGGQRAEIIWTEDEISLFHTTAASLDLGFASDGLRLAAATGLRREDLVTLTWEHIGDIAIEKKARKRSRGRRRYATIVRVPQLDTLLEELRSRQRRDGVTNVLVSTDGKPITPDRLTKAVGQVRDHLGIVHTDEDGRTRRKHLHDARGTFATRLMTTSDEPLTDQEVAMVMGWSPEQVASIRHHYVDQRAVVVALGERLRRRSVN